MERHVNLLAEGSYSVGSEIKDGYPEFTLGVLKKLGWDRDLSDAERAVIERVGGNNPDGVSWSKAVNIPSDGNRSMDPPVAIASDSRGRTVLVTENNGVILIS